MALLVEQADVRLMKVAQNSLKRLPVCIRARRFSLGLKRIVAQNLCQVFIYYRFITGMAVTAIELTASRLLAPYSARRFYLDEYYRSRSLGFISWLTSAENWPTKIREDWRKNNVSLIL